MNIKLLVIVIAISKNIFALEAQSTEKAKLWKTRAEMYVSRFHPGQDIMQTLTTLLSKQNHRAITISSATGSVLHCHIRFANNSYLTKVNGPLQITSITGTFDRNLKPHLHIAVADGKGNAFGGHLPSLDERKNSKFEQSINFDCPIYTTLQIGLLVYKDVSFERKTDPETTYDELTIIPHLYPLKPKIRDGFIDDTQSDISVI